MSVTCTKCFKAVLYNAADCTEHGCPHKVVQGALQGAMQAQKTKADSKPTKKKEQSG